MFKQIIAAGLVLLISVHGVAEQPFNTGIEATITEQALDAKDSFEQFEIGMLYYLGDSGVKKDIDNAQTWFEKAADNGHADAKFWLSIIHNKKGNMDKSMDYLYSAARGKNVEAAFKLGVFYEKGLNVEKNLQQAKFWYDTASIGGHAEAAYRLAKLLTDEKDIAREYYALSCDIGYQRACYW